MVKFLRKDGNTPKKEPKVPNQSVEKFLGLVEKNHLIVLGLIVVLFFVITIPLLLGAKTNPSQDAYWYMALSKNMFEKGSYSLFAGIEHQKYPPGFPFLIGIMNFFTKDELFASQLVALIAGSLTIPLAYLFGREFGKKFGILTAFFTATSFLILEYSVAGMTETVFGLFTLAGLYLAVKFKRATLKGTSIKQKAAYFIGFLLMGFSTLIRYTGFVTIATTGIMEVIENRKKPLRIIFGGFIIGVILFGIILAPWIMRNESISQTMFGNSYASEQYTPFNMDFFSKILNLNIIVLAVAIIGIYFYLKRTEKNKLANALLIFSILSILFYFWWGYAMTRFLSVLAIPIAVFMAIAVGGIYQKTKSAVIPIILILAVLGAQVYAFESVDGSYYWNIENLVNVKEAGEWAKTNIPADAILIVPDLPIYNYYLDRNDFSNVANYNALQIAGVLTTPKLYAIADEQHMWVSKSLLENSSNAISMEVNNQGQMIRIVRKFHEIKVFEKKTAKTPFLGIENSSGAVKVFEFEEPSYIPINK